MNLYNEFKMYVIFIQEVWWSFDDFVSDWHVVDYSRYEWYEMFPFLFIWFCYSLMKLSFNQLFVRFGGRRRRPPRRSRKQSSSLSLHWNCEIAWACIVLLSSSVPFLILLYCIAVWNAMHVMRSITGAIFLGGC